MKNDYELLDCKVVMLPTEKASNLLLESVTNKLHLFKNKITQDGSTLIPQHLYFVSDEQIKEGDWCIGDDIVYKYKDVNTFSSGLKKRSKKIVATTDMFLNTTDQQDRFVTQVPQISQSFIIEYVKVNGEMKEVQLEMKEGYLVTQDDILNSNGTAPLINVLKTNPDHTVIIHQIKPITADEMHLNMQYYMEYCQQNGYVTPQNWIKLHKHF